MTAKKPATKAAQDPVEPELVEAKITQEENALLENARAIRDRMEAAAQGEAPEEVQDAPGDTVPGPQQVQLTDERAQRELDLRVVNEQLLYARQALAAGKVNRLLNAAGMLDPTTRKHDTQWINEIREAREGVNYLIAIRDAIGDTGLPEPSPIEVPTTEEVKALAPV